MSEKENKYDPIRGGVYIGSKSAEVVWSNPEAAQLDRIERKLDKLLTLVEGKELGKSENIPMEKIIAHQLTVWTTFSLDPHKKE